MYSHTFHLEGLITKQASHIMNFWSGNTCMAEKYEVCGGVNDPDDLFIRGKLCIGLQIMGKVFTCKGIDFTEKVGLAILPIPKFIRSIRETVNPGQAVRNFWLCQQELKKLCQLSR